MAGYVRWLIAKGNVFLPSASAVCKLVERLRKEGWIVDPAAGDLSRLRFSGRRAERAKATGAYAVKTVENTFGDDVEKRVAATVEPVPAALTSDWLDAPSRDELRIVWPVSSDEPLVHYPLNLKPDGAVDYNLEIHRAEEYVYPTASSVGRLPSVCKCGEDLSFTWDDDEVVAAFGSATGIFAECDECSRTFNPSTEKATIKNPFDGTREKLPGGAAYRFALVVRCTKSFVEDPKLGFAPALVALVENEFGRAFYEVAATT